MKNLVWLFFTFSLILFGSKISIDKFESFPNKLFGDVDGDKKIDAVIWKPFDKNSTIFKLVIVDSKMNILWQTPKNVSYNDPYFIGFPWDAGSKEPTILLDINGDFKDELLVYNAGCDVSPNGFLIFSIKNEKLRVKDIGMLVYNKKKERFRWYKGDIDQFKRVMWIDSFNRRVGKKEALATIFSTFYRKNEFIVEYGEAYVKVDKNGATIKKWSIPLHTSHQEYVAKISKKDHFNSKGEKLTSIRDILQEDRANFYKGKGDKEDGGDGFFSTFKARKKIKSMWIIPVDISYNRLREKILKEEPIINVVVKGGKLYIRLQN